MRTHETRHLGAYKVISELIRENEEVRRVIINLACASGQPIGSTFPLRGVLAFYNGQTQAEGYRGRVGGF